MASFKPQVFNAFRKIGIPEDEAMSAAMALAESAESLASMAADVATLKVEVNGLKTSVVVMQWMLGTLIAGVAALVLKAFSH